MICRALCLLALLTASAYAAQPGRSPGRLYAAMPQEERDYYVTIFDYAMTNMRGKETYEWKTYTAAGSFTPEAPFQANGTVCRNFIETLSVNTMYSMASSGLACKRVGRDGWCRLRPGDAKTCAMEPPDNFWDRMVQAADDSWNSLDGQGRTAGGMIEGGIDEVGRQGERAGEAVEGGYNSVKRGARNTGDAVGRGADSVERTGKNAADTVSGWWPF